MLVEQLQKYAGLTVIVQLKEAMALGAANGTAVPAPQCNAEGDLLRKDGAVAPAGTKFEELAMRPVWPIRVQQDEAKRPEFRFAIEGAFLAVRFVEVALFPPPQESMTLAREGKPIVHIMYPHEGALLELTVEPEMIVGVTVVRDGPFPKEERSRIVKPD